MGILSVILKIIERLFIMLMAGERFSDIRSMCLVEYANYLHDKKDIEKAIVYYNRAISLNSNNYYAYGGLAAAQIEKGLSKQALESCNKAISIKPSVTLLILQSVIYKYLGEILLAEVAKQKTIEFFRDYFEAYNQLALTYFKYGMYEEAEYYCKEVIKLNPNDAGIYFHLAKIYSSKKQYQSAKDALKKVLELTSDKRYKKYVNKELERIKEKE